jgi:hypothetical protein
MRTGHVLEATREASKQRLQRLRAGNKTDLNRVDPTFHEIDEHAECIPL